MGLRRQGRSEPNPERRSQVTERDLWILESVGKMRFLTTSQLAQLHFGGSRSAANKRLRKLLDAGLVRVWVRDLARDNVYSIDRAGARQLRAAVEDQAVISTPRGLDGNLDHLLAINQVRISLVLELPAIGGELSWWQSDWELRAEIRARVIPDALFAIRWDGQGEQAFALELDNHTKASRAFVRKVIAYASATRTGGVYGIRDFVTLVVGRDPRWLERYRSTLAATGLGERVWFALLSDVDVNGAGAPVWKTAESDEQYSLRTLANLPYGKEGHDPETATATTG